MSILRLSLGCASISASLLLASSGCEDPDRSVSDVYADLSAALCQRIGRCCSATEIACTSGRALDEAVCRELVLLSLREVLVLDDDAVDEGRRIVDQDAAEECITATRDLDCDSFTRPPACYEMFPGNREVGEDCFVNDDCLEGARCFTDASHGICVHLQAEEEPCFEHGHCARDLYCSTEGYVCRPRAKEGEECDGDPGVADAPLCASGFYCDDETERCIGPGDVGDPCTPAGLGCREGLACSAFDFTCVEPRPNGEPCLGQLECESRFCLFDPGPQGVCAANPAVRCDVGLGLIGREECI